MFVSPIRLNVNFRSLTTTMAEMQATSQSIDAQAALINNAQREQALLRNADKLRLAEVAKLDKKLAMERVQEATKYKMLEAQKEALAEQRKKEAAKKS
jgi:hypothetical protein